jgi:hypothetical protein
MLLDCCVCAPAAVALSSLAFVLVRVALLRSFSPLVLSSVPVPFVRFLSAPAGPAQPTSEFQCLIDYYMQQQLYRSVQRICEDAFGRGGSDEDAAHFWHAVALTAEGGSSVSEAIRELDPLQNVPELALAVNAALISAHKTAKSRDKESMDRLKEKLKKLSREVCATTAMTNGTRTHLLRTVIRTHQYVMLLCPRCCVPAVRRRCAGVCGTLLLAAVVSAAGEGQAVTSVLGESECKES